MRTIRKFREMLGLLSRGKFDAELDEHLKHAIETLEALPNEQGTATITVTFKLAYQSGRLDITPEVKSKLPEGKKFTGTPFWTNDGELSLEHPNQSDMFTRGVAGERERDTA